MSGINFSQIDVLGFDLDHTLLRYKLDTTLPLVFNVMRRYLVEVEHYSDELLKVPYSHEFCPKGIIVDRQCGNLLKVDYLGRIDYAYHGSKSLSKSDCARIYENSRIDMTQNARYWCLSTYFEAPLGLLFASMVDIFDSKKGHPEDFNIYNRDYRSFTQSLHQALSHNFGQWRKGFYFVEIFTNPQKYLQKQKFTQQWLESLRARGVKLFLLTNSLPEYTDVLMSYSFGSDWPKLFDIVSVAAQKPLFFTQKRPFYAVQFPKDRSFKQYPGPEYTVTPKPLTKSEVISMSFHHETQSVHSLINGSISSLLELLDFNPSRFCYFGDHLKNDVSIPKQFLKWNTVSIVEELEDIELEKGYTGIEKVVVPTNSNHPSNNQHYGGFWTSREGQLSYWAAMALLRSDLIVPSVERLAHFEAQHCHDCSPSVDPRSLVKDQNLAEISIDFKELG